MNSRITLTIGGLLLVAATLGGCSGSNSYTPMSPTPTTSPTPSPTPTPGPAAGDIVITIVGMDGSLSYSPNPATARVGQTVAWKNADTVPHTATANGGTFNTGTIAPGATSSPIAMTAAGTFPYVCAIHPSMTGTLSVIQ
jgi:plastocyanin